jgi:hypothetical protein
MAADWGSIINGILVGAGTVLSTYNKDQNPSVLTWDPTSGTYYATNNVPQTGSLNGGLMNIVIIGGLIFGAVALFRFIFNKPRR